MTPQPKYQQAIVYVLNVYKKADKLAEVFQVEGILVGTEES
jgi:hypothetical protein